MPTAPSSRTPGLIRPLVPGQSSRTASSSPPSTAARAVRISPHGSDLQQHHQNSVVSPHQPPVHSHSHGHSHGGGSGKRREQRDMRLAALASLAPKAAPRRVSPPAAAAAAARAPVAAAGPAHTGTHTGAPARTPGTHTRTRNGTRTRRRRARGLLLVAAAAAGWLWCRRLALVAAVLAAAAATLVMLRRVFRPSARLLPAGQSLIPLIHRGDADTDTKDSSADRDAGSSLQILLNSPPSVLPLHAPQSYSQMLVSNNNTRLPTPNHRASMQAVDDETVLRWVDLARGK
ncbi:hypothetical protein BDR26DRAFT_935236 [Obelidium mucronatum]|nr:hypothetical protein BDR26DRAFT_935236 [Obelidium mucronatum]